jgi:hypothetical protein
MWSPNTDAGCTWALAATANSKTQSKGNGVSFASMVAGQW